MKMRENSIFIDILLNPRFRYFRLIISIFFIIFILLIMFTLFDQSDLLHFSFISSKPVINFSNCLNYNHENIYLGIIFPFKRDEMNYLLINFSQWELSTIFPCNNKNYKSDLIFINKESFLNDSIIKIFQNQIQNFNLSKCFSNIFFINFFENNDFFISEIFNDLIRSSILKKYTHIFFLNKYFLPIKKFWLDEIFFYLKEDFWIFGTLSKVDSSYFIHLNSIYNIKNNCFLELIENINNYYSKFKINLSIFLYLNKILTYEDNQIIYSKIKYTNFFYSINKFNNLHLNITNFLILR